MEIKERILQKADEMFFRYGVRSVTMDDIAQELGISKKTIYQHFEDKDAIVYEVALRSFDCDKEDMQKVYETAENPVDEVIKSIEFFNKNVANMNPMLLNDLRKYHPKVWNLYEEQKKYYLSEGIIRNFREGIEQGYYLPNINVEILSILRLEQVEWGFSQEIYPASKFNVLEIQETFAHHFLRGIMTEKGFEAYKHAINKTNESSII